MATEFLKIDDFPEDYTPTIEESHVKKANLYIERVLTRLGVSTTVFHELVDNPHLKELAKTYATYTALIEYYTVTRKESDYDNKIKHYRELLKEQESSLTLEILGISTKNGQVSTFASFPIMRG